MSLDIQRATPTDPVLYHETALQPDWEERVVIAVATSLAVLIVAAVTVLMGMA